MSRLIRIVPIGLFCFIAFTAVGNAQMCILRVGAWEGTAETYPNGAKGTTRKASVYDFTSTAVNRQTGKSYHGNYQPKAEYFPFTFKSVPEGTYSITVKRAGFITTIQEYTARCKCAPDGVLFLDVLVRRGNPKDVVSEKEAGRFGWAGEVLKGKPIDMPKPVYPRAASAAGATGEVRVKVLVNEDGNVVSATALDGNPLLAAAAEDAARKARFKPSCQDGRPVSVSRILSYSFDVTDK